jgi:hypothetical protein
MLIEGRSSEFETDPFAIQNETVRRPGWTIKGSTRAVLPIAERSKTDRPPAVRDRLGIAPRPIASFSFDV